MRAAELRPGSDDIIVGIDLAAREHLVVIADAGDRRLTRFRVASSRNGVDECCVAAGRSAGQRPATASLLLRPPGTCGRRSAPA